MSAALLPNNTQFFHAPITYQAYTFSTALTIDVSDEHSLIVNLNSAQRAPEIQELLSLGPHLATRSYDIGLLLGERQQAEEPPKAETLNSIELRWEWEGAFGSFNSAVFYTEADDFIYHLILLAIWLNDGDCIIIVSVNTNTLTCLCVP